MPAPVPPPIGDPAAALDAARAVQAEMTRRVEEGGLVYDCLYAGLVAVIVGGQGLTSPLAALTSGAGSVGLAALALTWARRTGVFVCGATPRRARWAAFAVALVALGAAGISNLGSRLGAAWAAPAAALVAGGAAFALSRLWRRLYRIDLQAPRRAPSGLPAWGFAALLAAVLLGLAGVFATLGLPSEFVGWSVGVAAGVLLGTTALASRRLRLRP